MPTYREQYDKIIQAYFKNEIRPFEPSFCFCGTLCNNSSLWFSGMGHICDNGNHRDFMDYSGREYKLMEDALLNDLPKYLPIELNDKEYEETLFNGMCAAIEVLKEIHISRGEKIDEDIPMFTKRELSPPLSNIEEKELSTNKASKNEVLIKSDCVDVL